MLRCVILYDHQRLGYQSCDHPERMVSGNQIVSDPALLVRSEEQFCLEFFRGEFKTGAEFEFIG